MAKKPTTKDNATVLQEAEARLKAATERHDAVVSFLSRLSTTPQDKRQAQAEAKKVDQELREAKRLLQEAQAAAKAK
ncbi:hypothetical protein LZ009_15710 [Ramlibacter sp. XY19]|uniref:hypothetical protein n=1 Tax=Ramlibacter paludis TaxID=2908000 RepID=UPI0023DC44EC|nr:hypothetical protein [Ramlibacter paludis]MCG2594229.1 hypothetical protein [Ramlibacter paludis]